MAGFRTSDIKHLHSATGEILTLVSGLTFRTMAIFYKHLVECEFSEQVVRLTGCRICFDFVIYLRTQQVTAMLVLYVSVDAVICVKLKD